MFENINFGKGVNNKYIDFDLNIDIPLEKQIDLLKEDLLQVSYDNDYLIDIGWYPEFDIKGKFIISIIKNYNWDNPFVQKYCRNFDLLNKYLFECVKLIQSKY